MNRIKALCLFLSGLFIAGCQSIPDKKYLTSAELKSVLVGNTELGHYKHKGYDVEFSQYYSPSGEIIGSSNFGPTKGVYEIRDNGCFHTDFFDDSGVADGCNYYTPLELGGYHVAGPFDSSTEVTVEKGNNVQQ